MKNEQARYDDGMGTVIDFPFNWKHGDPISGTYCGVPFSGVITESFQNCDYRGFNLGVELAAPVTVFGIERSSLLVRYTDSRVTRQ